jgi:hypothetical protein
MRTPRLVRLSPALLLPLLFATACTDHPTAAPPREEPVTEPPRPLGVYTIEVHGIGGDQMSSSISPVHPDVTGGPSLALNPLGSGIVFEQVSSHSFTEGARGAGGQRYVTFTYRVRNGTGSPINNLTILMVTRSNTIPGTPLSSLRRFDGVAADTAIAKNVVPTGAVSLGRDLVTMEPLYADVIQVYTEAEVAAIPLPTGVTGIFPYGYVVRHASSTTTRLLPVATDPNRFDGVLTLSFRVPLQPSSAQDVFSLFFEVLAVDDGERRVTESIEEQGAAGRAEVAAAAAALGATTVTVLPGSASTGYTGQRRICSVRTAGPAGSPVRLITAAGAYVRLALYQPGESVDACATDFRAGTPSRVGVGVSTNVVVRAMDRYGNTLAGIADTVALTSTDPGMTGGARAALSGGMGTYALAFSDYGTPTLTAEGRRLRGSLGVPVVPITRTWIGVRSSGWTTRGNWDVGAPASLDTAVIPAGTPYAPLLSASVQIGGVSVAEGATLSLGSYNLTASRDVTTGQTSGGIVGTGRVLLTGSSGRVHGRLPVVQVTGTYALSGNLLLKTPAEVRGGGGLESVGWMTEIRHY